MKVFFFNLIKVCIFISQSFISQVTAESQGIDMEFCVLQLSFVICIILQGFTYTMNISSKLPIYLSLFSEE